MKKSKKIKFIHNLIFFALHYIHSQAENTCHGFYELIFVKGWTTLFSKHASATLSG